MTITNASYEPPTPPDRYCPPPRPAPTRRRTAALVVGAFVLVSGLLTAISGAALLAPFGDGQMLNSGKHQISTTSSALVTDLGHISNVDGFAFSGIEILTGSPTLHLSAENNGETAVFVGIGPADKVDRYLAGVATETVTDLELSPFRLDSVRTGGTSAAQPPAEQTFWAASAQSMNGAQLTWRMENGLYKVVVMNADGSAGFATSAAIGVSLPRSSGLWIFVLSVGIVISVAGAALVYIGTRTVKPAA